jgi:hypothetical protein
MRILLICAIFAASVFAQRRGGGPTVGRVGAPPPVGRAPAAPPTARPPAPVRPVAPVRTYYPRGGVVAYPVFIGGGYYASPAGGDYGYANSAPIAVVNQDFQPDSVNPAIIDFTNVPQAEPAANTDENGLRDDQPTIFLIALTDHTVVAAIAYWADGDTLNWVSRDAKQNHLSLSLVDREFSKQLNDERHVEFKLPAAN